MVSIPDPNAEGYYSKALCPRNEQQLIDYIGKATADLFVIHADNAGQLLFEIWSQSFRYSGMGMPGRPSCLSTRDECNAYIRKHPDLVPLLELVHKKRAYAWFCESFKPSREEFDQMIDAFLTTCRPRMRELVENANDIPSFLSSWNPQSVTDENVAKHLSELRIPAISGGRPSLILHDLGEEESDLDKDRIARIPDIFSFAHHTVLSSTSGSGKTRLLLEGLCRRWGFYIVARPDASSIGSVDLWYLMEAMEEGDKEAKSAIKYMRGVAEKKLTQLLLARFLLLNLLVKEARELPGGLRQKEHRRLWVLLQAQPQIFGDDFLVDIFMDLTELLRETDTVDLKDRIYDQYLQLSGLRQNVLNPATGEDTIPPFFCVLDDAQITITLHLGKFMSGDNSAPRPILREIWLLWTTVLNDTQMRLVLSGTGIRRQALEDILVSSALTEQPYHIKYDFGAFEDPDTQAEYIKRYVPACWSDPRWKEFLARAWAWLHGRYIITATFVLFMLQAGYQCPHRAISEYVGAFTDFKPMNGKDWIDHDLEPQLPPGFNVKDRVATFSFEKPSDEQASMLCDVIYDQILYGQFTLSSFNNEARNAFVERTITRHKPGTSNKVVDEPLVIFAVLRWLYHSTAFSVFKCLFRDIHKHQKRKNSFEAYLAFYVRMVFETAPDLDAVFTFRDDFARRGRTDLAWQHENFELVTVVHADRTNPHVSVVTPSCGSAADVGFLAKSSKEVLEWISTNGDQFTFCFAPESLGPDLLFFVRSVVSGKLLLVVVQARSHDSVEKQTLIEGVRAVTPAWFWKSKDTKYPTADTAPFIKSDYAELANESQAVLTNVPLGLKIKGADYPVLRVFASWPGEAKLERTGEKQKLNSVRMKAQPTARQKSSANDIEDPDGHPLATLHLEIFMKIGEKLDEHWLQRDLEQKLVVHSRRELEEHDSESPRLRKRANLGASLEDE